MATRSKKFSHSSFVKTMVFLLMLACVAGTMYAAFTIFKVSNGNIDIIFENSYIESNSFKMENNHTINQLADLIDTYRSEEHILAGNTIDFDEEFDENVSRTPEEHDEMMQELIEIELADFEQILSDLESKEEPLYYVTDGEHTFTNTDQTKREQFESYPVYYVSEGHNWHARPKTLEDPYPYYGSIYRASNPENTTIFAGYTQEFMDATASEWNVRKEEAMTNFYYSLAFLALFLLSLAYLIVTTGRHSFTDKEVHMNAIDRLYVDVTIAMLVAVIASWFIAMYQLDFYYDVFVSIVYVFTLPLVAIFVVLFLSLCRHLKNKTFIRHSATFIVLRWLYRLVKEILDSGSVGMKIVVVVIVYPLLVVSSLVLFPITIAVAVWLVLKQVKDFNKIKDGTKLMREGNLQHKIDIEGAGEFASLAADINGINEGFKQAVHNELTNERMKTELITNVSHDIRTPLTSIITYTDLLKSETDLEKMREYIEILDQKSKRLKVLTDDLFVAAKASSGDIPVELQQIDIVALINQGIGEVSEHIAADNLTFKFNYPEEKMYVMADGNLLWRSIENILSNIFNYALDGSRVYIDITRTGDDTLISFKNISKYELNITEEELMERFKRGDESRSDQGSGLGLSITKNLIENQHGTFEIKIDGDLFKSMIYLPTVVQDDSSEMK